MAAAVPLENRPIGELMVSDVIGGVGELSGRTLGRLTGMSLPEDGATSLMKRAARAWNTPIESLTCEELRLLLGQDLGMPWIGPLACIVAARFPNATVTFYPGDLAYYILRKFPSVFEVDPEGARAVLDANFEWIDALMPLQRELIEQGLLIDLPLAHHDRVSRPLTRVNQDPAIASTGLFQQNPPSAALPNVRLWLGDPGQRVEPPITGVRGRGYVRVALREPACAIDTEVDATQLSAGIDVLCQAAQLTFAAAAYNLVRLPKLLGALA